MQLFLRELDWVGANSIEPEGLVNHLKSIIKLIISKPKDFDESAVSNIEWIGRDFMNLVAEFRRIPEGEKEEQLNSIFTSGYRFLCELQFVQGGNLSFELRQVTNFVHDNLDKFDSGDKQQLIFSCYTMPAKIAARLLSHPDIGEFKNLSEKLEAVKSLRDDWTADLNERKRLIEALKDNIKNLTSEYNFVGLVHGFQKLKENKTNEKNIAFWSLLSLGFIMLALPSVQVWLLLVKISLADFEVFKGLLVYVAPALLAGELLLLYFFRVVLHHFRSVKAQLLQIDLRIAICQFVESYAEYVSKIREKNANVLDRFESLIFSGLVADENGIPSTFDGTEHIANVIRSMRGSN